MISDTDPRTKAVLIVGYRAMSPARKLQIVSELSRAVQRLALADIRQRHPGADEREHMLRLASRRLDRETMIRVFGWDVERAGY